MHYRWMKNRQRLLTMLLAGSVLIVSGCSDTGTAGQETGELQEGEEQTEQNAEDQEDAGKPESGQKVPQVLISSETVDRFDPESGQWLVHAEYDTVETAGEGFQAVAASVQQWSAQREEELLGQAEQYASEAAEAEGVATDDDYDYYQYSIFHGLQTARADRRVISLIETNSEYTGGAHGMYGSCGITFDVQSGELLQLSDLVTEEDGFHKKAEEYIIQKLSDTYGDGLFPDYADTVRGMWEYDGNWYLDAAGVTFIFTPYAVGPYAMGEAFVTVPYPEVEAYLADPYLPERYQAPEGAGIARIPDGEAVSLFLSASDSQQEQLRVSLTEEEEEYGPVRIELGDASAETDSFARIGGTYLLCREDGSVFVIFDADEASDDFVTFVYEITDGVPEERDRQEDLSLRDGMINTDRFRLRMHLDVLGSYDGWMDYTISPQGKLEAASEWFEIMQTEDSLRLLVTVQELPVVVNGEETVLPVGSRIRITATDNNGNARFSEEDTGLEGEIRYVRGDGAEDSWTIYIHGIPDYEYFESVPYAG